MARSRPRRVLTDRCGGPAHSCSPSPLPPGCVDGQATPVVPLFGDLSTTIVSILKRAAHIDDVRWSYDPADEALKRSYHLIYALDECRNAYRDYVTELALFTGDVRRTRERARFARGEGGNGRRVACVARSRTNDIDRTAQEGGGGRAPTAQMREIKRSAQTSGGPPLAVVPARNAAFYELMMRGLRLVSEWTARVLEQVRARRGPYGRLGWAGRSGRR